jgi:hypothetical protein
MGAGEWKEAAVVRHAESERTDIHGWADELSARRRADGGNRLCDRDRRLRGWDGRCSRPKTGSAGAGGVDPDSSIEEVAHIAQTRSLPTEQFVWWKVGRAVNRVDPDNNGKHLLVPVSESA